jgi:A/G-specific adenine glycosylase
MDASSALLAWYERHRRELPWRACGDPWAVWVSEVMLQQTRVETVVPYFERFLARFPDPAALASAGEDAALALWSGLGYYRRARQLVAGARAVETAGGIPRTAAELERLPGVGPYTAAAIASIAFGEQVPVLDGNVARVLARCLAEPGDAARAAVRRRLLAAARELLAPGRAGDSNQALMELGATLCTPRRPRCGECPLAFGCAARAAGIPERFPRARSRPASRRVSWTSAVVAGEGRWLFVRREEGEERLAGLWELPTVEGGGRPGRALADRYGGRWRLHRRLGRVRHSLTRYAIELTAWEASWESSEVAEKGAARWATATEAATLPLTGATRKLLALLTPS